MKRARKESGEERLKGGQNESGRKERKAEGEKQ